MDYNTNHPHKSVYHLYHAKKTSQEKVCLSYERLNVAFFLLIRQDL